MDNIPTLQEVNDLKKIVASSIRAYSKAQITHSKSMNKFVGLEKCLNDLKTCVKNNAGEKGFPVRALGYAVGDFGAAIERLDAHKVPEYQNDINELLAPWLNKAEAQKPIIIGS